MSYNSIRSNTSGFINLNALQHELDLVHDEVECVAKFVRLARRGDRARARLLKLRGLQDRAFLASFQTPELDSMYSYKLIAQMDDGLTAAYHLHDLGVRIPELDRLRMSQAHYERYYAPSDEDYDGAPYWDDAEEYLQRRYSGGDC